MNEQDLQELIYYDARILALSNQAAALFNKPKFWFYMDIIIDDMEGKNGYMKLDEKDWNEYIIYTNSVFSSLPNLCFSADEETLKIIYATTNMTKSKFYFISYDKFKEMVFAVSGEKYKLLQPLKFYHTIFDTITYNFINTFLMDLKIFKSTVAKIAPKEYKETKSFKLKYVWKQNRDTRVRAEKKLKLGKDLTEKEKDAIKFNDEFPFGDQFTKIKDGGLFFKEGGNHKIQILVSNKNDKEEDKKFYLQLLNLNNCIYPNNPIITLEQYAVKLGYSVNSMHEDMKNDYFVYLKQKIKRYFQLEFIKENNAQILK